MYKFIHYLGLSPIVKPDSLPDQTLDSPTLAVIFHFVFAVAGVIALLMVSIASFRYVISRGDPEGVKKAKNTIIYSLIGLALAMTSYGIVTFVFRRVQ